MKNTSVLRCTYFIYLFAFFHPDPLPPLLDFKEMTYSRKADLIEMFFVPNLLIFLFFFFPRIPPPQAFLIFPPNIDIRMLTVRDFPGLSKFTNCDRTPPYLDTKFTIYRENLEQKKLSDKNGPQFDNFIIIKNGRPWRHDQFTCGSGYDHGIPKTKTRPMAWCMQELRQSPLLVRRTYHLFIVPGTRY